MIPTCLDKEKEVNQQRVIENRYSCKAHTDFVHNSHSRCSKNRLIVVVRFVA